MLERPGLDERCARRNPTGAGNYRSDPKEHENAGKSPQVEPCHFQNFGQFSSHPCPMLDASKARYAERERAPAYFPQPEDDEPPKPEGPMTPIGPWATGRVSYNTAGGITGVRPVVDRYSITRYSPAQWRARNRAWFDQSSATIAEAQSIVTKSRGRNAQIYKETDSHQSENRDRLCDRAGVVHGWRAELERALAELIDEIEILEGELRRVKQSLSVLTIPESIAGDFLQLRSSRLEPDLVRDSVEEELVKEMALCSEIRGSLVSLRERIEAQLIDLKFAKSRLEFDYTDKKDAYEIEDTCVQLNNDSPLILLKPGATRIPSEQSTPASYDHFARETLEAGNTARQKSIDLRSTLDSIYQNAIRDLRSQAMAVDTALADKVHVTEQICQELEAELVRCLSQLSTTEDLIEELRKSPKRVIDALKVAQTRLDNRLHRLNVESCRDVPQYGLIEEVKLLNESLSTMARQLKEAENAQAALIKTRGDLEHEIAVKKKSLYVDRDRGQLLRSFYPTAQELSGHA